MNNKKIHLDLGTHFGQGLNDFISMLNINSDWAIYSFEANPITYNQFKNQGGHDFFKNLKIDFLNKAVGVFDGLIEMNLETAGDTKQPNGMASTIINLNEWHPWDGTLQQNFQQTATVECIDFSNFVSQLDGDFITCKMDIEGAEFDILEKMIADKSILKINKIWIEFHDHFFINKQEMFDRKNNIIKFLSENKIEFYEWH